MKLLATLGALIFSGLTYAVPLHNVVVFGDSLSDNGNFYEFMKHQFPQSPPYFEGRFSNGPVWIEQLLATYYPTNTSAHLLDYAFGGAGVSEEDTDTALFTLQKEINTYLLGHDDKASADSLFVVWIGSNNYFGMPSDGEKAIQDNNRGLTHGLERLAEKGAKHILVINLPDLGKTPAAIELNAGEALTNFSNRHNEALNNTMVSLKERYPQIQWLFFDVNKAFTHVVENPSLYGFTDLQGTCYSATISHSKPSVLQMVASVKPGKTPQESCDGYLFFDLVHPTMLAHHYIADKARQVLDAANIELVD